MSTPGRVLACVDQSRFADAVTRHAVAAAHRLDAPLELLYVINLHPEIGSGEDHSGAIGIDAQEHLLQRLTDADAVRAAQAREVGRVFLNRLREQASTAGVARVDIRQRRGNLEETLIERQHDVELVVLGRRGEAAERSHRELGRNVERIVLALQRPILVVPERFFETRRFMVAFDGALGSRRVVETIAASALLRGIPCDLLMSGKPRVDAPQQMDWARSQLEFAGFSVQTTIAPGDPETMVHRQVVKREIDLLVMGAYAHSPLRRLLMGSRTEDLLRSATVPVLLLR